MPAVPFPIDPYPGCECEATAIRVMGYMFASIGVMVLLLILMIYFYVKVRKFLPILVIYVFSLIIGMASFSSLIPFFPWINVFFILFQSVIFMLTGLDLYNEVKR